MVGRYCDFEVCAFRAELTLWQPESGLNGYCAVIRDRKRYSSGK